MRSIWTSLSAAVTRHPGRVVVAVGATVAALAVGLRASSS